MLEASAGERREAATFGSFDKELRSEDDYKAATAPELSIRRNQEKRLPDLRL